MENKYQYRLIARVVLEATTPLALHSGQKEINTDATVAKDVNGMPFIPGTSIAGVIRHALKNQDEKTFFGYQDKDGGQGSEIMFSEARMIGKDGKVLDGLQTIDFKDEFYTHYKSLPVRQHVKINHKGSAEQQGKFDEEVVFKGTRFCFEIEVLSKTDNNKKFNEVLKTLYCSEFRLGSGSRKGFGKMKVVSCKSKSLNLEQTEDLHWYLNHTTNLAEHFDGDDVSNKEFSNATTYKLTLQPDDFFLFGAGFGDDDVDLVPVKENQVIWENDGGVEKPQMSKNMVLIPASSIKGALAHRVAFHYNKKCERWAEDNNKDALIKNNEAVVGLFGSADKHRGIVLFEDIIEDIGVDKIFNHVKIDRFTGGAIDGALFNEKAAFGKGKSFSTTITLLDDTDFVDVFEEALKDICKGMLQLGGGTTKGYGFFKGKLEKNNEEIINEL